MYERSEQIPTFILHVVYNTQYKCIPSLRFVNTTPEPSRSNGLFQSKMIILMIMTFP